MALGSCPGSQGGGFSLLELLWAPEELPAVSSEVFNSDNPPSTLSPVLQHLSPSNKPCPAVIWSTTPCDLCTAFTFKCLLKICLTSHWIQSQNPAALPLGANSPTQLWEGMSAHLTQPHSPGAFDTDRGTSVVEILFWLPSLTCSVFCKFYYGGITLFNVLWQRLTEPALVSAAPQLVLIRIWWNAAWEHTKIIQRKKQCKGFFSPMIYSNNLF